MQFSKIFLLGGLLVLVVSVYAGKKVALYSPDKQILVSIDIADKVTYSVSLHGTMVLVPSPLSMTLEGGKPLGVKSSFVGAYPTSVNTEIKPGIGMASAYPQVYNEVSLKFKEDFNILFRAYNNGVAYRFQTNLKGKVKVKAEEIDYNFPTKAQAYLHPVSGYLTSYEENYIYQPISYLDSSKLSSLPIVVESNGVKVCITESDVLDYPAFYLTYDGKNGLLGSLPPYVSKGSVGGCCPNFERIPYQRADYLAETDGTRSFPWRLMILAEQDKDLLYNNLVYLLASESRLAESD